MEKITLTKFSQDELIKFIESLGEKRFRANQIFSWIWAKNASSFDDMTDVKKEFRALLNDKCQIFDCKIKTRQKQYIFYKI